MKQQASLSVICILTSLMTSQAIGAIALDRTRIVVNGTDKSMSVTIRNDNKSLPYLAQAWLEDDKGNKVNDPLVVLPPVQRVEPGTASQVKIQSTPAIDKLPTDRESIYYFNLREIPPRTNKPNTMQIALQTRVKLFWRPKSIVATEDDYANPWQKKLELKDKGNTYEVVNPTPYYVTVVDAAASRSGASVKGFTPIMIAPKSTELLPAGSKLAMGAKPVLTYVNDFGGRPKLVFSCASSVCKVSEHFNKE